MQPLALKERSHGSPPRRGRPQAGFSSAPSRRAAPFVRTHSACACGGGCPRCQKHNPTTLPVSQPDDAYEREADHVASQVLRMPTPASVATQNHLPAPMAQTKREPKAVPPPRTRAAANTGVRGGGRPLDEATRAFFEPRFGYDFSHVRVHEDAAAPRAFNAQAFTVGADIVFGADAYAPHTHAGRALLAHELTHVIQQTGGPPVVRRMVAARTPGPMVQRAEFRDGCGSITSIPETDCGGTIDVLATTITLEALAVFHLFIVFTDRSGRATVFRGGPERSSGGYGHIITICGPYAEGLSRDWDPAAPSERVYDGPDACHKAQCFREQLQWIADHDIDYVPTGPNSNSVVTHLLRRCGLPVRKPAVTAPGFNMEFTDSGGVRDAPGASDRRHRLSLGVAGRLGDLSGLGLSAGYSVDLALAFNQALRFPLRLGVETAPERGAILGSASIGLEAPFLNIPLPGLRIPTTIGASVGVLGGGAPSAAGTGGIDPLLGILARPLTDFGFDIGRARIDLFYQMEWLRNLQTNRDLWNHILGVEIGATF